MSGHSKWKTIKHKKGAADAKRGQLFTKIAKIITIAAKEGGGDPTGNFKLRLAMEKAKAVNMPKDNIQRAIDRGTGKSEGEDFKEGIYEGFGPLGTAFIVEIATDNTNRTSAEVRTIFSKNGGNLASQGAVSYLFEKCGYLLVKLSVGTDKESLILEVMEIAGIKDVLEQGTELEVYTEPEKLREVRDVLLAKNLEITEAELTYKPTTFVKIADEEDAQRMIDFMEKVEDHEDVQKVHSNFDIDDEILSKLEA